MSEYMSGDELYKFLHISKRKMKYLLENGYIPYTDTGKKTHRYLVRKDDAEAFIKKMNTSGFLHETAGKFSSRANPSPRKEHSADAFAVTDENCASLRRYITSAWVDQPEALTSRKAEILTGIPSSKVNDLIRSKTLVGANVCGVWHCTKTSLIQYATRPETVGKMITGVAYRAIIVKMEQSEYAKHPHF